jgi:hypothetical protein
LSKIKTFNESRNQNFEKDEDEKVEKEEDEKDEDDKIKTESAKIIIEKKSRSINKIYAFYYAGTLSSELYPDLLTNQNFSVSFPFNQLIHQLNAFEFVDEYIKILCPFSSGVNISEPLNHYINIFTGNNYRTQRPKI